VIIEYLIVKDTIDEKINELIERKRKIISDVVGEDKFEELEDKTDEAVEEEYSADIMQTLKKGIEALKELTTADTFIDEEMVRNAAAQNSDFTVDGVQAVADPGTRRFKAREVWLYVQGQGGVVTEEDMLENGFTKPQIKGAVEAGALRYVEIPRVLKNSGRRRHNPADAPYLPVLTLASMPRFTVKPGQMRVRKIQDNAGGTEDTGARANTRARLVLHPVSRGRR
jgi:hypothetical protein